MGKRTKGEYKKQLDFMKDHAKKHPLVYKQKTIKQVLAERNDKK